MEMNPKIFCTYIQSAAINVPWRKWQISRNEFKYFITKVLNWQGVRLNVELWNCHFYCYITTLDQLYLLVFRHKQYNLVLTKGQRCCLAEKATTGLAVSKGTLSLGLWLDPSQSLVHFEKKICFYSKYQIKSNQIYLLAHKHTLQETINVKQNEN